VKDDRQAKLTSVDYLMVILTKLGICSEYTALAIFQRYRQKIFYTQVLPSYYGAPRCVRGLRRK
jgi:hypothetical protein